MGSRSVRVRCPDTTGPFAGRGHEGAEETLAMLHAFLLWMPEQAETERPVRILDGLDRAIVGERRHREAVAETTNPLMMMGGDSCPLRDDLAEAPPADPDVVPDPLAHRASVDITVDLVVEVLHQVAAVGDVEELEAPADSEHGKIALERST
jgi:hypothetical protein